MAFTSSNSKIAAVGEKPTSQWRYSLVIP